MILPVGARVVVKRLEEPKPQSQLIEIPESIVDVPSKFALVLSIGKLVNGGIRPGDTVILKDYVGAAATTTFGDETIDVLVVSEDDVLAVVSAE